MSPNELILSGLFQILLLAFLLPGLMMQEKPFPAAATPTYCIESHPDYDREKCETEDPLHRWRRLQEERIVRQSEWKEKGCKCSEIPENNQDKGDPFAYSEKVECERACGMRPYPDYEFEDDQTDAECDPENPGYDEEKCETEDPLHRWRRLQEERLLREWEWQGPDCSCLTAAENQDPEDPLAKWRKLQCERVCKDANQPKQD
ncbi:MAG: hypothetical protein KDI90_01070 [Alphaproteobacteria bacterium]|nr:hypothetical protein [Alphaproteobacteria bacterium]